MLNKLTEFIREYDLICPGDRIVAAVSGGADSVALLFALYLLKDKLQISLAAAHFNHHLRGEESDRDEEFVRQLCDRYDITLHVSGAQVTAGEKGLEAAARDARYAFLRSLPGKVATAHTADDNAETVLMHLVRGTGLKGLGGITPVHGRVIRPMLSITRDEVEDFLREYCLTWITDSSNHTDAFLRNRLRHHVMPLLRQENPRIGENLSAMALRLRQDEACLARQAEFETLPDVKTLRQLHGAVRSRMLESFLKDCGVQEPEQSHIALAESLVFSEKPSARASFPGGITLTRRYDRLERLEQTASSEPAVLTCPGETEFSGFRVRCVPGGEIFRQPEKFTVVPEGTVWIRSRQSGDTLRLTGGSKSVKKLFIDRKIPAAQRDRIPIVCDDRGILGICGIGPDQGRVSGDGEAVTIEFEKIQKREKE